MPAVQPHRPPRAPHVPRRCPCRTDSGSTVQEYVEITNGHDATQRDALGTLSSCLSYSAAGFVTVHRAGYDPGPPCACAAWAPGASGRRRGVLVASPVVDAGLSRAPRVLCRGGIVRGQSRARILVSHMSCFTRSYCALSAARTRERVAAGATGMGRGESTQTRPVHCVTTNTPTCPLIQRCGGEHNTVTATQCLD